MYSFASDNASVVHPKIMEALSVCNENYAPPYGADSVSSVLNKIYSDLFEHEAFVFPVSSGTAANGLALAVAATLFFAFPIFWMTISAAFAFFISVRLAAHLLRIGCIEKDRAIGIEYLRNGTLHMLRAEREVILSGGTVNSPQLLQLSGIGDPDHLKAIGIKPVHDLKGVGMNLQDHPGIGGVKQRCLEPITAVSAMSLPAKVRALAQYVLTKSGPAANNGLEAMAFVKTRPGLVAPDLQYFMTMLMYEDSGRRINPEHGYMVVFTLQRPESRGNIRITSVDPREAPAIDPNYFERDIDLQTMREGVKIGREIFAQKAFDPYRGSEYAPGPDVRSDAQIEAWIRQNVDSNYHTISLAAARWAPIPWPLSTIACEFTDWRPCASSTPPSCQPSSAATPTPRQ
jgi:hypothetical protein